MKEALKAQRGPWATLRTGKGRQLVMTFISTKSFHFVFKAGRAIEVFTQGKFRRVPWHESEGGSEQVD